MSNSNSWLSSSIDDIVFENRNKSYGAYLLRRIYDKNMTKGILAGLLFFLFLIFAPQAYAYLKHKLTPVVEEDLSNREVTLAEPPPIDPNEPEPPPPPPVEAPKPKAQIQFVPPKVEEDEKVVEEIPPPDIVEVETKVVSTATVEGEESEGNAAPDDGPKEAPAVIEEDPDDKKIFSFVQQKPEFPDGEAALLKYLYANIKYPPIARENGIEGQVVVRFVVSKTGKIDDVKILRSLGGGCDEEASRVVRAMPAWKPGKHNGKAVNCTYTLPIKFQLQ